MEPVYLKEVSILTELCCLNYISAATAQQQKTGKLKLFSCAEILNMIEKLDCEKRVLGRRMINTQMLQELPPPPKRSDR